MIGRGKNAMKSTYTHFANNYIVGTPGMLFCWACIGKETMALKVFARILLGISIQHVADHGCA